MSKTKKQESLTLSDATQQMIAVYNNEKATRDALNDAVQTYYRAVEAAEYYDDVADSMKMLTQLFTIDNVENGSEASIICGGLVEDGFSADAIVDEYTAFYKAVLDKAAPFLHICEERIGKLGEDEDKYELIDQLKTELATSHKDAIKAFEALDKYYLCGVTIFSSSIELAGKGLILLADTTQYEEITEGCFYLTKLLQVLYEEPILVIDLTTLKGIKGKMSGVVDNFQLQILLMGLDELNEEVTVPKSFLDVIKGEGEQSLGESITGKWNMYNWEYLKNKAHINKEDDGYADADYWIWSEGTPLDISPFNGYTVILLGTPAYERGLQIQRTFTNLKAEIAVEEILSLEEVNALLAAMSE